METLTLRGSNRPFGDWTEAQQLSNPTRCMVILGIEERREPKWVWERGDFS